MGRRGAVHKNCVARRWSADQYPFADDPAKGMADTWCGERRLWDRDKPFPSPRLASCPKCSAAIGKARLKALSRLELVKDAEPANPYLRSSYTVVIDGEPRGYIGCEAGWGTHWNLYQLGEQVSHWKSRNVTGSRISGARCNVWDAERWPTDGDHVRTFWPVHWASKEAMAAAAWTAWEAGQLPTLAEQADAAERERVRRQEEADARAKAREEAERAAAERARERTERLESWALAYADLIERADLSNLERAGLLAARALIGSP